MCLNVNASIPDSELIIFMSPEANPTATWSPEGEYAREVILSAEERERKGGRDIQLKQS